MTAAVDTASDRTSSVLKPDELRSEERFKGKFCCFVVSFIGWLVIFGRLLWLGWLRLGERIVSVSSS
jgi:hypothetical protein